MSEIWDRRVPEAPSRIKQPNNRSESEVRRAKPTVTSRRNISISSIFSGPPPFPPPSAAAWRPSRCYAVIGRTPRPPNRARASRQSARQRTTGEKPRIKSPHGRLQQASNGQRKCKALQPSARAPRLCTLRPPRKTSSGSFLSAFIGVHRRPIWFLVFASDRKKGTSGRRGTAIR